MNTRSKAVRRSPRPIVRARAESDSAGSVSPEPVIPTRTSFRHLPPSPEVVRRIEEEVARLRRYFDSITSCHVVVEAPHRHHRSGRRYALHLELGVPRGRLVVALDPAARTRGGRPGKSDEIDAVYKDVNVAIRDAFAAARRQLKEHVRRLRGDGQDRAP